MIFSKIFKLTGVILSIGIFFCTAQQTNAIRFEDGKCQAFEQEGKKIVIFTVTDREDSDKDPIGGTSFCVEVVAPGGVLLPSIGWVDLQEGSENMLKKDWSYNKIVRWEMEDECGGVNLTAWKTIQDLSQPADVPYMLSRDSKCDTKTVRQRYRFEVPDASPLFLYFIKIADINARELLPSPIPICAEKNGTDKDTCEKWNNSQCYWRANGKCAARADASVECSELISAQCAIVYHCKPGDNDTCVDKKVKIDQAKAIDQYISERYKKPDNYEGPLPDCAFTGSCRSVEDLLELGVKIADWLFSIIAGLAFVFFVYGGLTMVLSLGNAEKVGQGKQILVAATLGLIITFSAYILVGFVVKAIGINAGFTPFN